MGGDIQSTSPLRRIVNKPLKAFDDVIGEKGTLLTHQQNQYHQWIIEAGKNFLLTYHQTSLEPANRVWAQREAQAKENRERSRPIIAVHARHYPCSNHLLNNSLARSSEVTLCRNASATMKKVGVLANASAKRHNTFKKVLGKNASKGICQTCWVERHEGHLQFHGDTLVELCYTLYDFIVGGQQNRI
ncbi:hypothetical protein PR048_002394 [Dryococelus australis]|uniref:Uncharacterized protein n=1 Tax=Dryococelus australis TaxID=614101 RepID=A0ABQ9IK19_9NEOP|nr:hypothetical protein PR048_002394 [Dryococelus australis]